MIDLTSAKEIASRTARELDLSAVQELREGWYFPYSGEAVGSSGVIVNKASGRVLVLGSAFPVERDLRAYDEGFQFETCDLVVTAIHNLDATIATFAKIRPTVIEPQFEHGQVWRIPRELSRDQVRARLARLPCIFERTRLYFVVEHLQEARASGWFDFVLAPELSTHR